MKKLAIISILLLAFTALMSATISGKLTSKKSHISFYSHTSFEDITANNYKAVSTLDTQTGELVFSVPMQSFEFEKALMQKHYNSKDFLDTKKYPKAKLVAMIQDINSVKFDKDGSYKISVKGKMTIKGVTNDIEEMATLIVKGEQLTLKSTFDLTLEDYKIAFEKGKPSTNVAKTLLIKVETIY